jgi:hypothetical protein
MRFFDLLNLRHVALFVFPTLIFVIVFAMALRRIYFRTDNSAKRLEEVRHVFPGNVGARNGPAPLALILIIAAFIIWALFYAVSMALMGGPI